MHWGVSLTVQMHFEGYFEIVFSFLLAFYYIVAWTVLIMYCELDSPQIDRLLTSSVCEASVSESDEEDVAHL